MKAEFGMGRLAAPDPRDRKFLLQRPVEAVQIEQRYWITRGHYDQGDTSQCVAYSWVRWLTTSPVVNRPLPFQELYDQCQRIDEWPGEDYDGTSVRAGAKVLKQRGLVSEYRWAFDVETVIDHVLAKGPVVLGTDWTHGMMWPDKTGFIKPIGQVIGGHAYTVIGATRRKQAARIINSWGRDWGENGRAWIAFEDLDKLVKAQGEACVAMELKK
jgi:hypothetical protein